MSETERSLPLFPLEQVVLFPGMSLPLRIFEERYKLMIGTCQVTDQLFGVLLIRHGREVGEPAEPERVGCTARLVRLDRLPDGQIHLLSVGEQRFRLLGAPAVTADGYLAADVRMLDDEPHTSLPPNLVTNVASEYARYQAAALAMSGNKELARPPQVPNDPLRLSYQVAASLYVHPRERQQLLELDDLAGRLEQELTLLKRENRPPPTTIGPFSVN
jgi:Lon protease-like protein